MGPDHGPPYLLVSNRGVTYEDQGDFEKLIGYNRRRGDTCGPLTDNGEVVSFMYELCLSSMLEV